MNQNDNQSRSSLGYKTDNSSHSSGSYESINSNRISKGYSSSLGTPVSNRVVEARVVSTCSNSTNYANTSESKQKKQS